MLIKKLGKYRKVQRRNQSCALLTFAVLPLFVSAVFSGWERGHAASSWPLGLTPAARVSLKNETVEVSLTKAVSQGVPAAAVPRHLS